MIEATNLTERLDAYRKAFETAKQIAEQNWHPAWRRFHQIYTRRKDGAPLVPTPEWTDPQSTTSNTIGPETQLAVNHVQSVIRTEIATTLNRNPEFTLEPEFEGFHAPPQAKMASHALNFCWRKERFNEPIRDAVIDSMVYGRGWVRHGWQETFTREIPLEGQSRRAILREAAEAVAEASRRGTTLGRKPLTTDEIDRHLSRFSGRILLEDKPTLRRVSPFDMFFDPLALEVDDARWIAQRWRCPRAFARTNQAWSPKHRKELADPDIETTVDPVEEAFGSSIEEYGGRDTVWVIDFFDLANGTWCQFSPNSTGFLRKPEPIPFPFGQPFRWIENVDDTAAAHPISEVEIIWPQQQTLADIEAELGTDRIQSRPKILVERQVGDQVRPALEAKDQGVVVEVESPAGEGLLAQMVQTFTPTSRATELMAQLGLKTSQIAQASGVSDYLRGGGDIGGTATEVNARQVAAANFMGEKAGRIRDFIEINAQMTLMLLQVFSRLDFHLTTKMPNEAGQMSDVTLPFDRSHISGTFRVIVSADSTEEKTPQAKMARAQMIASTAMPFAQAGVVDLALLFKYVMKEGFGIDDPTALLTPQAYAAQSVDPNAPAPQGAPDPSLMGGISMTPGSAAGQLGATVAEERTALGDMIPQSPTGE